MREGGRVPTVCVLAVIRGYRLVMAPLLLGSCRFEPSCSRYAEEAVTMHGAFRGGWLALRRVLRCHPFGGAGFDPVPARRDAHPIHPVHPNC